MCEPVRRRPQPSPRRSNRATRLEDAGPRGVDAWRVPSRPPFTGRHRGRPCRVADTPIPHRRAPHRACRVVTVRVLQAGLVGRAVPVPLLLSLDHRRDPVTTAPSCCGGDGAIAAREGALQSPAPTVDPDSGVTRANECRVFPFDTTATVARSRSGCRLSSKRSSEIDGGGSRDDGVRSRRPGHGHGTAAVGMNQTDGRRQVAAVLLGASRDAAAHVRDRRWPSRPPNAHVHRQHTAECCATRRLPQDGSETKSSSLLLPCPAQACSGA